MRAYISWTATICSIAFLATGCSRIYKHEGYVFDQELAAAIQPEVDNRESVRKTLGQPSIAAEWSDDTWYYISRDASSFAFSYPRLDKQKILVVSFNANGDVSGVRTLGREAAAYIKAVKDKTRTTAKSKGILEDIFGNIGTISPVGGGSGGNGGTP